MPKEISHALYLCYLEKYEEAFPLLMLLEDKEEEEVYYYLGICFYYGYGTKANKNKGISYLNEAAKKGSKDALFLLGELEEDNEKKYSFYQKAYLAGSLEALEKLVELASNKTKRKELISFINNNEKDSHANFALAKLYFLNKEIDKGMKALLESIKDKNEDASLYLAKMYEEGNGVNKDLDKAAHYYREAAYFDSEDKLEELASFYMRNEQYEDALYILNKIDNKNSLYLKIHLYELLDKKEELFKLLKANYKKDKLCASKLGDYYLNFDKEKALSCYLLAYDYSNPDLKIKHKILSLVQEKEVLEPVDFDEYIFYINSILIEKGIDLKIIKDKQILKFLEAICYRFGLLNYRKDKIKSDSIIVDMIIKENEYSYLAYIFTYLFSTNLYSINPYEADKYLSRLEDNYINDLILGFTYLFGYVNPRDYLKAYEYFIKANELKPNILNELLLMDVSYRINKEYKTKLKSTFITKHLNYISFFKEFNRYEGFIDNHVLGSIATQIIDYPPFSAIVMLYKDYLLIDLDEDMLYENAKKNNYPLYLLTKASIKEKEQEYEEAISLYEEAYFKNYIYDAIIPLHLLNKKKYDSSYLLYAYKEGSLKALYYYVYFFVKEGEINDKLVSMINICYDMGIVNAGIILGMLYMQGRIVDQDITLGQALIKKATEDGASIMYDEEVGVIREK